MPHGDTSSSSISPAKRWVKRPEGSNWGEFGADDQLGRLNLLTPAKVRAARAEIREGRSFCLSLPLDFPGGRVLSRNRAAPCLHPVEGDGVSFFNCQFGGEGTPDIECDDAVTLTLQYSSHWDSFAHIGHLFDADGDGVAEPVFYNGFRAGEHLIPHDGTEGGGKGALRLGVENIAETGVQGRGVLIDLHHHFANADGPVAVTFEMLSEVMQRDEVAVEEGDIVCFHTGFSDALLAMQKAPDGEALGSRTIGLQGRDPDLLRWISESGVVALAADNFAVEAFPAAPADRPGAALLPLHEHCLFKLGIPLGELWNLGEFARWMRSNRRSRFFLTAPPLRLPGAVASPVTPVATV